MQEHRNSLHTSQIFYPSVQAFSEQRLKADALVLEIEKLRWRRVFGKMWSESKEALK